MHYKNTLCIIILALSVSSLAQANQMNRINSELGRNKEITELERKERENQQIATESTKDNSDKSDMMNKLAMGIQYATSAVMATSAVKSGIRCGKQVYSECPMAVLYGLISVSSMMQGNEHKKAAATAYNFSGGVDGLDGTTGLNNQDGMRNMLDGDTLQLVDANINGKMLEDAGLYNRKTGLITGADGKKYDPKTMSSPGALKAAGFSDSQIGTALGALKKAGDKVEKGLTAAGLAALDGGGGGGGGTTVNYVDEEYDPVAGAGTASSAIAARDPANLAGLSKNYNGEPIGVAADSIFLMMTRRYKVKDTQESFFSEIEMPVINRRSK